MTRYRYLDPIPLKTVRTIVNIGLLLPAEVCEAALDAYQQESAPFGKRPTGTRWARLKKVVQYLHGHLRVEGGSETRSAAASRSSAASA
jgi:hypothetical protein